MQFNIIYTTNKSGTKDILLERTIISLEALTSFLRREGFVIFFFPLQLKARLPPSSFLGSSGSEEGVGV